jgi:hypothetical protein
LSTEGVMLWSARCSTCATRPKVARIAGTSSAWLGRWFSSVC